MSFEQCKVFQDDLSRCISNRHSRGGICSNNEYFELDRLYYLCLGKLISSRRGRCTQEFEDYQKFTRQHTGTEMFQKKQTEEYDLFSDVKNCVQSQLKHGTGRIFLDRWKKSFCSFLNFI